MDRLLYEGRKRDGNGEDRGGVKWMFMGSTESNNSFLGRHFFGSLILGDHESWIM
uniref:Uncharacterized protein n=1 Tax=Solanum lycopersicum TaxID=4081 RepID=K4D6U7_SOLLC